MYFYKCLVICLCLVFVKSAFEGESCFKDGAVGVCANLRNCQPALDDIRNRRNPQICTFDGVDPIVCCVANVPLTTTSQRPVVTTSTTRTTTVYVPPVYDYQTNDNSVSCGALPANQTAAKTGQKAWDKCIDYQEQLLYPCERGVALTGELSRADNCKHTADQLIVGGENAAQGEFPHMVLLGYGDDWRSAEWLCGGSLISDRFILTAGHCTVARDFGDVAFAWTSTLKRSEQVDSTRVYRISRIIKHPDYKPPMKYNDIALLQTETQMKLDQFTVPACLDIGNTVNDDRASATGWGATQNRGSTSDIMLKVTLTKFSPDECSLHFPVQRLMKQGYDVRTQICYGDKSKSKDTCQGDSGGPLQVKSRSIFCMYTIIGITSFGRACGFIGEPGIYTRVSAYVPWIESIVWA